MAGTTNTIKGWGLQLNGQDNRDIRFCIRRSRLSFVAINECGVPLIETILPYAANNPAILKALIALSTRQRKTVDETSQNIATTGNHSGQYQSALEGLRREMHQLSKSDILHNEPQVSGVLASALLLSLFGFPESNSGWSQHVSGMLSIINSTDLSILVSSPLGRFLLSFSSHLDISAFSIGRTEKSHRAWLVRNLGSPKSPIPFDPSRRAHGVFSPLEVITAYPESLTTIIAMLSQDCEDQVEEDKRSSERSLDAGYSDNILGSEFSSAQIQSSNASSTWSTIASITDSKRSISAVINSRTANDKREEGQFHRTESLISDWNPPRLPRTLTSDLRLALSMAWEVFRKAVFIFYWRGRGFYSDLRRKIREDRSARATIYIQDIISNIRSLVGMAKERGFVIANAMLWPLTVIACECDDENNKWQSEIFDLLEIIQKTFAMGHLAYLKQVLKVLWKRKSMLFSNTIDVSSEPLCLEGIARELNLTIPLF